MCGKVCCGLAQHGNHTRAGTVPDRRGRCGIELGTTWRGEVVPGRVGSGKLRLGMETKLVQARGRINAGGLGCTGLRLGGAVLGTLGLGLQTTTRSARFGLRCPMVG